MLFTITSTHYPASDLSFLVHKHPAKVQQVELSVGLAHIFYPEVSDEKCTVALLLDIDPVGLVRKDGPSGNDFALEQYVNDRPYVASSFMSAAISKAYSSAMNGRCKDKPELVSVAMPFEVMLSVLPVRGGENLLRQLFEPLGYVVSCERHMLDPSFPEWGESRYFTVRLSNTLTLQNLLSHLYVLIAVCDYDKHYWIGKHEVEKLLEKGGEWLPSHPMRELITNRYLKNQKSLTSQVMEVLQKDEEKTEVTETETAPVQKLRMHDRRLQMVVEELGNLGCKTIVDLGCGEGKLLKLLLKQQQFHTILGVDVSYHSLEIARQRLKLDRLPAHELQRIKLIQGALTYRDKRIEGFEAAVLVEVIEHLDETRLAALERVVFEFAKPQHLIITTPNADYNVKFTDFGEGQMRHKDHRFEWSRLQFQAWGDRLSKTHNYSVLYKPVGEEDPEVGALSQMAIFQKQITQ